MQAADFRNPTLFAQVERASMRASAGCFRPGMPLPFAPRTISKRVETADERSRVVVWWGASHPAPHPEVRRSRLEGGLQPAARSLKASFEAR
jgi:hypothetical protein